MRCRALVAVVLTLGVGAVAAAQQGPPSDLERRGGRSSVGGTGSSQGGGQVAGERAGERTRAGTREPGRPKSLEIAVGGILLAPGALGSRDAMLTQNQMGTPVAYRWFTATAQTQAALGAEGRVAWNLTRQIGIEGGVTYSRPVVQVAISNDAEQAQGVALEGEAMSQFFVDAAALVYLPRLVFARGRARPFVSGGAGYLRQLHGQTSATSGYLSVDTGVAVHGGGGMKYFFAPRPTGALKGVGLRVDVRLYVILGGYSLDGRAVRTLATSGGIVLAL